MQLSAINAAAALALVLCAPIAAAHVGVVNIQFFIAREGTHGLVLCQGQQPFRTDEPAPAVFGDLPTIKEHS